MGREDQGLDAGSDRYRVIPRVLVFVRNGRDVLLLKGAADKRIWANLYNGVGGHVEAYEDILSAARRELGEETGLDVWDLELKALVNIDAGRSDLGILMFVFVGWSEMRESIASAEGELHWLPLDQLAESELVEDLAWLLPRIMEHPPGSQPLFLHYSYDENNLLVIRSTP